MKKIFTLILLTILAIDVFAQDCSILAKANNISPDRLCAPVSVVWNVNYTGVNNNGTSVQIRYDWNDGTIQTVPANNVGAGIWEATLNHTYTSAGNLCNYHPRATLVVNGVLCSSSTQEQIVTVWDDDNHNGGRMRINPVIYPICFGNNANARFRDVTQFNCVPPQERDVPNVSTRWVQWIYGTDITMTGIPVTINGIPTTYPDTGSVITLLGPVTGSGVLSEIMNVANDKQIGEYFQVTLRNWNYCNPYDDPNISGPPTDPVNGDHPPVTTTAIILIVPIPDATIIPMDTLCLNANPIRLTSVNNGGVWNGNGVVGNTFNPTLAGIGTHLIRYTITTAYGCVDWDTTRIVVEPPPIVNIAFVGTVRADVPPITLSAIPTGGIFSGTGVINGIFYPRDAGVGTHIIQYQSLPDKNGCIGIDTIHIQVILPPTPTADFKPDTIGCTPLIVQFVNNSLNGETYLWEFGDKTYSTEMNPIHTYYTPGVYLVRLTVTNMAGEAYANGEIRVFQNPIVIFNIYPTDVINNTQIVRFYNLTMYGNTYLWRFGDGYTSTDIEPWHKYEKEGEYNITLIATSVDGCVDSLIHNTPVKVDFKKGTLKYPNAFVWNRSGPTGGYWQEGVVDNTVFRPHFTNVIEYHLEIYNRWGTLIYTSDDIYKGWDGYWGNGNLAMQGVYVYKATGRYADGKHFKKVGDVTFLH